MFEATDVPALLLQGPTPVEDARRRTLVRAHALIQHGRIIEMDMARIWEYGVSEPCRYPPVLVDWEGFSVAMQPATSGEAVQALTATLKMARKMHVTN